MTASAPVSICVPTYQGARWVGDALRSALAQTYADVEVLVVDDASTDGSADVAASFGDPRVRVVRNEKNLGLVGNWEECVRRSHGEFVKFLFQDDVLAPACVERLLAPLREHGDAAFAYGPRDLVLDDDAGDEERRLAGWIRDVHALLGDPPPYSPPGALFARWSQAKCLYNVIGEPTCTLVRRAALERVGLFHRRLVQLVDMELWGRLAFFGGVAFVPETLCTFRVHRRSATSQNVGAGRDALDRVWLLEGLLGHEEIATAHPELRKWRRHELSRVRRRAVAAALGRGPRAAPPRGSTLGAYVRFRLARLLRCAPPLHGSLGAPTAE